MVVKFLAVRGVQFRAAGGTVRGAFHGRAAFAVHSLSLALTPGATLALYLLLLCAWPAAAQNDEYHFREQRRGASALFNTDVLNDADRSFLRQLPAVRVAVSLPAYTPFEQISPDGEIGGIHTELLLNIARAFGIQLVPVVFKDFSQALEAARRHEVDLLMSMGVSASRLEYLEYTLGVTPMVSARFGRRDNSTPPERARFALEKANISHEAVNRLYPDARRLEAKDGVMALDMVSAGDADYYVGTLLPTLDRLSNRRQNDIEVKQLLHYGSGYFHFAVRKDWAPLAGIINKGLATLRHARAADPAPGGASGSPLSAPTNARVPTRDQLATLTQFPVWRVGAVRGLELLNDYDAHGHHTGIGAEYIEAVARSWGVGLQVVPFDSVAQMLDALEKGALDVAPFITRTPSRERERHMHFSRAYAEMPYTLVARSVSPMYWGLASLRGKRLALTAQHPLREFLAKTYPDIQVVEVAPGQGAMDAVLQHQADAAVEVKLFANLRINRENDGVLRITAAVEEVPAEFHMATSAHASALVPLINTALADIAPPERQRMLQRWVALDVQPQFNWARWRGVLITAAVALLVLGAMALMWTLRLRREVQARLRSERQLRDITATLPCVAFRAVYEPVPARGADADAAAAADSSAAPPRHEAVLAYSFLSDSARRVLGCVPERGRQLLDLLEDRLHPADAVRLRQRIDEALRLGRAFSITGPYHHPDLEERWLHLEVVPKAHRSGRHSLTGFVADVTVEHALNARLAQDAEQRHLMLASASHELRAPTHTLSLALHALSKQPQEADAAHQLRVARDAVRTLGQLLNDVLDAARMDQSGIELRPQAFRLPRLLDELGDSTRAWAADKGLVFKDQRDAALPAVAVLDPLRLRQVLVNLLANAVRYTERGSITLRSTLGPAAASGLPSLQLAVEDTGRGMRPEQLEQLFTPYAAAEASSVEVPGSTGLGLSICRRLVQRMGGSIHVHSVLGMGTRVLIELPLPLPEAPVMGEAGAGAVLLCDDDDTSRVLLAAMLQRMGYQVEEAASATQALAQWRRGGIAALITDLELPGMSGIDLIRGLRELEAAAASPHSTHEHWLRRTRVVICSGHPPPPAGPGLQPHDAYLAKPVEPDLMAATLQAVGVWPSPQQRSAA